MLSPVFDPSRDLQISRLIKAPRSAVWRAWTDRTSFEQWWVPAPAKCRVQEMDLRPGGALITLISEHGGDFVPHPSACFLAIDDLQRQALADHDRPERRHREQAEWLAEVRHLEKVA